MLASHLRDHDLVVAHDGTRCRPITRFRSASTVGPSQDKAASCVATVARGVMVALAIRSKSLQ
jgi:hypothetical protein